MNNQYIVTLASPKYDYRMPMGILGHSDNIEDFTQELLDKNPGMNKEDILEVTKFEEPGD